MKKKKIIFLSRLFHPHVGGVEKHLYELSKQLIKDGAEVTVVTEQYATTLALVDKQENISILRIPKNLSWEKIHVWLWMLSHFSLFLSADIIHTHDVFWWYAPLRILLFWKSVYTTFHGYEGSYEPSPKAVRSRKLAELLSKRTICIGAWMKKWYGHDPSLVLYGAANSIAYAKKPQKKTAVFLGRLSLDTGIREYVEATMLLHGKISLDIYGEGQLLSWLKETIKDLPYIHYKGVVENGSAVFSSYRFAFVSRYLAIIEAMQSGRYVFAHWNNAIKRDYLASFPAIEHSTIFSLPSQLAEKLGDVDFHSRFEKCHIQQAQAWAVKQTWEYIAKEYQKLWKK